MMNQKSWICKIWQKLGSRTIVASNPLQENLKKSVSCQFCHADITLLGNVSLPLAVVTS